MFTLIRQGRVYAPAETGVRDVLIAGRTSGEPRARTKGALAEGKDADVLILDDRLEVQGVLARGRLLMEAGKLLVTGAFEA